MAESPELIEPVSVVNLYITQADVSEAERYGVDNPVIYALQQETRTLWRISDCGVALEVTPPYRSCVIDAEVLSYLRDYQRTGFMPDCEFEVELKNGSALPHSF